MYIIINIVVQPTAKPTAEREERGGWGGEVRGGMGVGGGGDGLAHDYT